MWVSSKSPKSFLINYFFNLKKMSQMWRFFSSEALPYRIDLWKFSILVRSKKTTFSVLNVQCAVFVVFSLQCYVCSVQCSVFVLQQLVYSVQCTLFCMQRAVCSVKYSVCSVKCKMYCMQFSVCRVKYAVCSVHCAV